MYEMMTGRVPFDADTPVSVALKHMQEEPVPPIEINPNIPSSINDIILKAMRKDTTLRYQSATQMLHDLNLALKNPDGDFVDNTEYEEIGETRQIPTLNNVKIKSEKNKGKNKKESFFKKHKKLSIFLLIAILFIVSIAGTIIYNKATRLEDVPIPNLVGISREEAEKAITDGKLTIGNVTEEYNSEYAEGFVISQDPQYQPNFNIKEKTAINFVVSLGIEEAIVPKVVGMKEDEAVKALEDAKLKYEVIEESSKKVEKGYVIEQETEPETKVLAGDTVKIHVSTGVKMTTVPSVIGEDGDDAESKLKKLGLKVVTSEDEDTSKENGTVIKQSIDAGSEVEYGSSITITVNKIIETKNATVTVNVKSLLNGKVEYEETPATNTNTENETNTTSTKKVVKNVTVKILVDGDTVYKDKVDPTTTNLMQSISGKGTVTVKVYIDDVMKKQKDVNLNEEKSVTIE